MLVEVETAGDPLVVVTGHWNGCNGGTSEFRQAVESLRIAQGLGSIDAAADTTMVLGTSTKTPMICL